MVYPEPELINGGEGNVAQALTRLATSLDFRIVVVDDRRDLADPQAFSEKVQLTFGDIPQTIRELEPDDASWIVVVTPGHHLYKDTLRAALVTHARYLGIIRSAGNIINIL